MENQNCEEPARVKHEPPVEFVLILPRPTIGWPAIKKEGDKLKRWVKSVQLTKFDAKWQGDSRLLQTYFACPHCQHVVKSQSHLTQHLRSCYKISRSGFECDNCEKRFQQKSQMRQHMLRHSSKGKFCCAKCGVGFKTKQALLNHSNTRRIFKCAVCDAKFSCKLLLDRHRSEFHGNVFKCDKCSYETRTESNLMRHKRAHNKPIACETCQKKFSTNQHLKLHQMQHRHGIYATAPETFDCDKCDKWFSRSDCLKQHQRKVHDEIEAKCRVCNKICKNRNALIEHSLSHVKIECSICNKTVSKQYIALHMRMHSAENIFECDLCECSTKAKNHLKSHIERKHLLRKLVEDSKYRGEFSLQLEKLQLRHGSSATTNEKKFKCDQSNKA